MGEISGEDSAAEEEDVEGEEDKEEDGGVFASKRGLSAARSATEAWREGGSLASL